MKQNDKETSDEDDENESSPLQLLLERLLDLDDIRLKDIQVLDEEEQVEFGKVLHEKLAELNNKHTRLLQIMGEAVEIPHNRLNWENNHLKITTAINTSLKKTGQMPNQTYIAQVTGLSRQTVSKHMASGENQSVFAEHLQQFTMMAPQVLGTVLNTAVNYGNMQAIKLYFEILEKNKGLNPHPLFAAQNNYIQINNTVIKQETLQQLSGEQLKQIEEIIRKGLPGEGVDLEKKVGK